MTATTSAPSIEVNFLITAGPNAGASGAFTTDSSAPFDVSVFYDDAGSTPGAGNEVDTIRTWIDEGADNETFDPGEEFDDVNKTWYDPTPTTLDCEPESQSVTTGASNDATCTVTDQFGVAVRNAHVESENETASVNDPDVGGVTPGDYHCTTPNTSTSNGQCTLAISGAEGDNGFATIRAWIDLDADHVYPDEADVGETAGVTDGDGTDVFTRQWSAPAATTIDCTPDTASNQVNTTHNITCNVKDQFGVNMNGVEVDGEIIPPSVHDLDGGKNPPPDFTSTTAGAGNAPFSYSATTAGTDTICFWIDDDGNDDNVNESACTEAVTGSEASDPDEDIVQKTWTGAPAAQTVECTPETASNQTGSTHTITCTADQAGALIDVEASGANDEDGNAILTNPDHNNCASPCTFDHGTGQEINAATSNTGTTTYRAWIDADGNNSNVEADVNEGPDAGENNEPTGGTNVPGDTPEPDDTDVVTKSWTGAPANLTGIPDTDTAPVGACNVFTVTLTDSTGNPIQGATIDVEQVHADFGPPDPPTAPDVDFCDQGEVAAAEPNAPNPSDVNEDAGDDVDGAADTGVAGGDADGDEGGETTAATNAAGQVSFGVESEGTGNVTVRAFFDVNNDDDNQPTDPQDSGTKQWQAGGAEGVATLDCELETEDNPDGTSHTFTCTAKNSAGQALPGVPVVFDVVAGPNAEEVGVDTSCGNTNQAGVATCSYNDTVGANSPQGQDKIVGYVNQNPPRGSGPGPQSGEPQDEILKNWTAPPTNLRINLTCDTTDGLAAGELGDADNTDETETTVDCTNPVDKETEIFTATVTDTKGTAAPGDDSPASGVQVNFTVPSETVADAGDLSFVGGTGTDTTSAISCNTTAGGTCSVTLRNTTPDNGDQANVDAVVAGQVADGTGDRNDRATKRWEARVATSIDLTPASDINLVNTQHTVTGTVSDQFGGPVAGAPVDFRIDGGSRNAGAEDLDNSTDAQGKATFTYTDTGPSGSAGTDTIRGWIDTPDDDLPAGNIQDTATKRWQVTAPATSQVQIDMEGCNGNLANPNDASWDAAATDNVIDVNNAASAANRHQVCATAFQADNTINFGAPITFTLTGPGQFTNATGTANLGTSVTITPDENGRASTFIKSTQVGTSSVTATSEGKSDTGTKKWVNVPDQARIITLTPETASNPPGSTHQVTAKVTDVYGNPVAGAPVRFAETGPATLTTPADQTTDANGEANAIMTSNLVGTSTITATIQSGGGEGGVVDATPSEPRGAGAADDECEEGASVPFVGAPAGACVDTATKTWAATATTTAPPGGFPVNITLEADKSIKRFGRTSTLSGSITGVETGTPAACTANREVILERTIVGTSTAVEVARTNSDASGLFSFSRTADRSANYVARVEQIGTPPNATCDEASSAPESVLVRKAVSLTPSDRKVAKGTTVDLKVKVKPCAGHEGDRVTLWKAVAGTLAKIASKKTNNNCVAHFFRTIRKDSVFQARSPKQDADHLRGKSTREAVQVK